MMVTITGVGLWAAGLESWQALLTALDRGMTCGATFNMPKPEAIPARERRRAGLTINLAVEVMHQACEMAGVDKAVIGSVFASAMGDTDITDYMCRKLASDEKLLSPTRFHNSVHNATSGYWSISAVNRQPSSFVGGFRDSFACGLLEAAACAAAGGQPVGLAAYDIANRPPFDDVLPVRETLGIALILVPGRDPSGWPLELSVEAGANDATLPRRPPLRRLAHANPAGAGLGLLEAMAENAPAALRWPVGRGSLLHGILEARRTARRTARGEAASS